MREHPDSPIVAGSAAPTWDGPRWFPYDPAFRVRGVIDTRRAATRRSKSRSRPTACCVARASATRGFRSPARAASLAMYWLEGYGGGLWLPFSDATSGAETYGGGRYLYDTIKGADLGIAGADIVLDFNFAYNPSCAYDERWSCPLSPPENRLPFAVDGGRADAGMKGARVHSGSTSSSNEKPRHHVVGCDRTDNFHDLPIRTNPWIVTR